MGEKEKKQEGQNLRLFDFYCITSHTQALFYLSKPVYMPICCLDSQLFLQSKRMLP